MEYINKLKAIKKFPEIKEDEKRKYEIFFGLVLSLSFKEFLKNLPDFLTKDFFKYKLAKKQIEENTFKWSTEENNCLFRKLYSLLKSIDEYSKKERVSRILFEIYFHVSPFYQNKLLDLFLSSKYKNNRKRGYKILSKKWMENYRKKLEENWEKHEDEEIIEFFIDKLAKDFLNRNFVKIIDCFNFYEDYLDFDRRLLRNRIYARFTDKLKTEIKEMKQKDPISFVFIKKEANEKIDPITAIKIYKETQKPYLLRWYGEMNLWPDIAKKNNNFFKEMIK
jgi:hypothetical protein